MHVERWALVFTIQKGPEHAGSERSSREAGGEGESEFRGLGVSLKEQGLRTGVPLWRMAEARSQALP